MTDEELRISYDVKEMFEKVNIGLGRIEAKLDQKADQQHLDELANTVRGLDRRVSDVEKHDRDAETLETFKATLRRRLYAAATLIVAIGSALTYIHWS